MNADGFELLDKLESADPEVQQELKRRIALCAMYARAEREAEESALKIFCETKVKRQAGDADKDKPDAFGIVAYLLRRLLLHG